MVGQWLSTYSEAKCEIHHFLKGWMFVHDKLMTGEEHTNYLSVHKYMHKDTALIFYWTHQVPC